MNSPQLKPLIESDFKDLRIYFTSDTHFSHENIISHQNRPFKDVDEMNEYMIEQWNSLPKGARIYHLGDFSLGSKVRTRQILEKLKGQKYLIRGNHDYAAEHCRDHFIWIKDYAYIAIRKYKFNLCHYPFRTWRNAYRGAINLHGHTHGMMKDIYSRQLDMSVERWNYRPVSIQEVVRAINSKEKILYDESLHSDPAFTRLSTDDNEA